MPLILLSKSRSFYSFLAFVAHCIICVYVHAYVWGMRLSTAVGRSGPVVAVGATDVVGSAKSGRGASGPDQRTSLSGLGI